MVGSREQFGGHRGRRRSSAFGAVIEHRGATDFGDRVNGCGFACARDALYRRRRSGSVGRSSPFRAGGRARVAGCASPALAAAAASWDFFHSASRACRSMVRISSSKAILKSVEALRNSAIILPRPRASSGSLWGPKTTSTTIKMITMMGNAEHELVEV